MSSVALLLVTKPEDTAPAARRWLHPPNPTSGTIGYVMTCPAAGNSWNDQSLPNLLTRRIIQREGLERQSCAAGLNGGDVAL